MKMGKKKVRTPNTKKDKINTINFLIQTQRDLDRQARQLRLQAIALDEIRQRQIGCDRIYVNKPLKRIIREYRKAALAFMTEAAKLG